MRVRYRLLPVLLPGLFLATPLLAQPGIIVARASDAATARPLPTVQVSVTGGGAQAGGLTGEAGRVAIQVPPGTYSVRFERIGMEPQVVEGVQVAAGESVDVTVRMEVSPVAVSDLVITVSRNLEKKTTAPATTYTVGERTVEERPASTPADYLVGAPGVDIIRQGIQSTNVVVRGFNNIFSGALHALTDNRIAGVPSLRVNLLHFIPSVDDDIARMEVVLGPGSALYGPNTANGVLHIITKSPLAQQGTTVSLAGGQQDILKGTFRTAHLLGQEGNVGVKLSGQFMRGTDWRFTDPFEVEARNRADADPEGFRNSLVAAGYSPAEAQTAFERVGLRDFGFQRFSAEARADWRLNEAATWIFQAGLTSADGVELTGIGAGQTENWMYSYYQTRFNRDRLFAQLYLNRSDAGDSFLVRRGVRLVDNSNMLVGQIQHGFGLGARMGDGGQKQDFTYGIDVFLTTPQTEGQINGQYEDDDEIDEVGGYIQSETALTDRVDLIAAARVDKSSILDDAIFSPRAALVWEMVPDQSLRFTYNRAFSTPTTLNYFLDVNGGLAGFEGNELLGFFQRAQAPGRDGLSFQRDDGSLYGVRSPLWPDPGEILSADAATLWPIFLGVAEALAALDPRIPAELPQILQQLGPAGLGLNTRNPVDGTQRRVSETVIPDAPPLRESITETFEVGYQGLLENRLSLAVDAWYSRRKNFTSPLIPQTPLITYNADDLQAKLEAAGLPAEQAALLAGELGKVPIAVVTSDDVVTETADIVATYRNFGKLDLFGWDVGFKAFLNDRWTLEGSASWIDDDFFVIEDLEEEVEDPDSITDVNEVLSLNAPDFKGSMALGYRNAGFTGEGRVRFTSEFPVNSADFVGMACLEGLDESDTIRPCVESFGLVDVLLGYEIADANTEIQLHVTNLFDEDYRSFVGVPAIGRLALLQVRYTF